MPSTEQDYIENEYYVYNRHLFRLIGLWDYQRSSKKLIYVCFVNLIILFAAYEQIYAIFSSEEKLNSYTELLETTIPTLFTGSCYYNLIWNASIMKRIIYRINYDWKELANKREVVILKEYAKLSRKCTATMIIMFYIYVGFLIFPPFLRTIQYFFGTINYNELILPVHIDLFTKNLLSYYFGFCLECIILSILCTVAVANYSMFIGVVLHGCALFNVVSWRINERFKEIQSNDYYDSRNVNLSEENEWIVDVIKCYKTVIEFVNFMKLFYEATNLLEGFLALIVIMLDYYYLFQLLSFNINKTEGLTKLSYVIGSMFVIFVYFYLGQKLIDHSNNVYLTICQIPFYTLSLKTQRIILFLTMRSMCACNLSWEGAIVVSHNLFTVFIQKSLSFAMVFHSLQ